MPPTNERTAYGYYIRSTGSVTLAEALAWSRDLMAQVRADGRALFDLFVDLRGQEPYTRRVAEVVRQTMAWTQEHGARRSAVVSDDPALLLLTRMSARAVPGVYAAERYFNALHGTAWAEDARRWLELGVEPEAARPDEARAETLALFDTLSQPLALFDAGGAFVRGNTALLRLLPGPPPGGNGGPGGTPDLRRAPIGAALADAARAFAATANRPDPEPAGTAVDLGPGGRWRLEARVAPGGMFGAARMLLVSAAHQVARPPTDDELVARYGLTWREVQVARLIAQGLLNPAIAERLGTSRSTARNHVSSVLSKIGVDNRTALTALLLRGEDG